MRKLIKKYQYPSGKLTKTLTSSNPFGQSGFGQTGLSQKSNSYGMPKFNLDAFNVKSFDPKSGLLTDSSIKDMSLKNMNFDWGMSNTGVKPTDTAKGFADAGKTASAAKFAGGMNVASQLADPILQVGEETAKLFGAKFAEKDAQSGATD